MAQITEIIKLNPDRVPVNIRARVISLWSASREDISSEGRLEDSTGIIPFILWKTCPAKKLKKGQQYLFHRAGLGKIDGELMVQFGELCWVYPVDNETDLYRIMIKITRQEKAEREKTVRNVRITRSDQDRTKRTKFSIAIAAGFVLWLVIMVLTFTDLVTEKKIRNFFRGRQVLLKQERKRKAATIAREGMVEEVLAGGVISVMVGKEYLTIHYLGLEIPPLPVRKGTPIDPIALQALNFNRFLARNKTVRLEFEEWLPPESGEARAYVFVGDKMLNVALLERGLARVRKEAGDMTYADLLSQAEQSARSARRGIWR